MSTQTTTFDLHGGVENKTEARGAGFWRRVFDGIIASRQARADRAIAAYLAKLTDQDRKDLGYPTIVDMR